MIAAIYARKSTEQLGLEIEQRSIARQIEHARAYAAKKGWTIDEASIFVDDGVSGAEFSARPGFVRLMNALKPRPAFQVLIMSEESRLGREAIETAYALKQLVTAGVRVFFYLEDRERTLSSPTDKIMLSLTAFADELEREKARQRTYDAMRRKAEARHVTGGRCFGYRNVDVIAKAPDGQEKRQYVRREIEPDEAAVVRRIFELCAAGEGLKGIAKALNGAGARAPRAQQRRPVSWAPSSVRAVLYRDLYRGIVVWNKTQKRDSWGQKRRRDRDEREWLRVPAEDLRIVSEALWAAAHRRLSDRRENYRRWRAGEGGEPDGRGVRRHYLLSGFGRCTVCGGSMQVVSRESSSRGRRFRYVCGTYWNRGATVCANRRMVDMEVADRAIRDLLADRVLRANVVEKTLTRAVRMLQAETHAGDRTARRSSLTRQLRAAEQDIRNLVETVKQAGAVPAIVRALNERDAERRQLEAELAALDAAAADLVVPRPETLRAELAELLEDWHGLVRGNVEDARPLLREVLVDRIRFTPEHDADGAPLYELQVPVGYEQLLSRLVPGLEGWAVQDKVASPTGTADKYRNVFREVHAVRVPAA